MNIELEKEKTQEFENFIKSLGDINKEISSLEKEVREVLDKDMVDGFTFGYNKVIIEMVKSGKNYNRQFDHLKNNDKLDILKLIKSRLEVALKLKYLEREKILTDFKAYISNL